MATPQAQVQVQVQVQAQLNLLSVICESKRIINAHSRHFLALSVLFLLPISFSLIVLPTLILSPNYNHPNTSLTFPFLPSPKDNLLFYLSLPALASLLPLLAAASVSSSVLRGFFGRPVRLLSTARATAVAFFPLLATSAVIAIISTAIVAAFVLLGFLALSASALLGFPPDYSSPFFLTPIVALLVALVAVLLFLLANWALVTPIVVTESTWGVAVLRRSVGLVKGSRGTALSLLAFLGVSATLLTWVGVSSSYVGSRWKSAVLVVQIVIASTFLTIVLLYGLAANTVLYMYCKAVHGELAVEIAEEFATEYVCLPFDSEKVPHVVSVARVAR